MASTTGTFVLTSGRSGSTFLARVLATHPEVVVVSDLLEPAQEDPYFDQGVAVDGASCWQLLSRPALAPRIAHWRETPNAELLYLPPDDRDVSLLMAYTLPFLVADPWPLRGELQEALYGRPVLPIPDHFLFVLDWLRDRFGAATWVERTGGSLPHATAIVRAWPEHRFVLLARDPVETALSMRTGSFFRLCLALEDGRADDWLDVRYADPGALAAMIERWTVQAEQAVRVLPADRLLRLTYERLVAEPVATLTALIGFTLDRAVTAADVSWATARAADVVAPPSHAADLADGPLTRIRAACPTARALWSAAHQEGLGAM